MFFNSNKAPVIDKVLTPEIIAISLCKPMKVGVI